jgi:hypothetical protein
VWWKGFGRWIGRRCLAGGGTCVVALRGRAWFFDDFVSVRCDVLVGRVFDRVAMIELVSKYVVGLWLY